MTDPITQAAIAETRAQIAWEDSRGEPFTVQVASFEQLRKAYDERVALCRKWIKANPAPATDEPDLFTEPLAPHRLPIPASPTGAGQGPGGAQ